FSTGKNFKITESQRIQFRAEFFNLANHPNFRIPTAALFNISGTRNVNAGRVDATRSPERQLQFGLKYIYQGEVRMSYGRLVRSVVAAAAPVIALSQAAYCEHDAAQ